MAEYGADEIVKVYENTYIMQPEDNQRFRRSAASKILKAVLDEKMEFTNERDKKGRLNYQYSTDEAAEVINEIVQECQKRVIEELREKTGGPPRYKLVFQASFGENMGQMVRTASRCLWDADTDNCASASWDNGRVYAVAMCFALYFE